MFDLHLQIRGTETDQSYSFILPDQSQQFVLNVVQSINAFLSENDNDKHSNQNGYCDLYSSLSEFTTIFPLENVKWVPPSNIFHQFDELINSTPINLHDSQCKIDSGDDEVNLKDEDYVFEEPSDNGEFPTNPPKSRNFHKNKDKERIDSSTEGVDSKIDVKEEAIDPSENSETFENGGQDAKIPQTKLKLGNGFKEKGTLESHKPTHESENNHSCEICLKQFTYKHGLIRHRRIHTGEKSHMCTWCGQSFSQKANMQKHIRQQHTMDKSLQTNSQETKKIYCSRCKCDIILLGNDTLKKHTLKEHKPKVTCPYCAQTFLYVGYLKQHFEKCHREATCEFLCNFCGLISETIDLYLTHLETHMVPEEQQCHICKKVFTGRIKFDNHMKYMHRKKKEACPEVCPFCGKVFKVLQPHIKDVHINVEMIKCIACDFTGKKKSVYDHYKKVHKTVSTTCNSCGKLVKNLNRHVCPSSSPVEKIPCDQCSKTFSEKSGLKSHIKNIHTKSRDIECEQCNYKTYSKFNLKIHVTRVHEGKTLRSRCEHCNKEVIDIERHIRVYHQVLNGDVKTVQSEVNLVYT